MIMKTVSSPAINKGVSVGTAGGYSLNPIQEYVAIANSRDRVQSGAAMDDGAFEFGSSPTVAIAGINQTSTGQPSTANSGLQSNQAPVSE